MQYCSVRKIYFKMSQCQWKKLTSHSFLRYVQPEILTNIFGSLNNDHPVEGICKNKIISSFCGPLQVFFLCFFTANFQSQSPGLTLVPGMWEYKKLTNVSWCMWFIHPKWRRWCPIPWMRSGAFHVKGVGGKCRLSCWFRFPHFIFIFQCCKVCVENCLVIQA